MKRALASLLICVLVFSLISCHAENDQDKIKKIITEIQEAGETKEIKKIMEHISETYIDARGFDYDGIKGLLLGYFFRYPKISVYITGLTISVKSDSAAALFQAVLTSGPKTGSIKDIIPDSLGVWDFDVTLEKESGDWKVTSAKWEEAQVMETEG